MSIYEEKGTLSAQQDCRSEWTLLRSETRQCVSWQGKGTDQSLVSHTDHMTFTDWQTPMHNEQISARPVCHRPWLSTLSATLLLFPFVLCSRAPLRVTRNRFDSFSHFLHHLYAIAVTSIRFHRLFVRIFVCALTPHAGCLVITHTRKTAHRGVWSFWKFLQTLIQQFSVSAVMAGWQGCHSWPSNLQALEVKTNLWCCTVFSAFFNHTIPH